VLAQLAAGLLVEEARKTVMPLPGESGPTETRQLIIPPRLTEDEDGERQRPYRPGTSDIAVVGAGALGTWFAVALGLAQLRGRRVHLYDGDHVEETNLNRQVLFFDALGRPKAPALAGRLQRLFPATDWAGYGMVIDRLTCPHVGDRDVLVACPDSFAVRAFLNDVARMRRQPLLSGGTSAVGGSCSAYVPGNTPCLACLIDVERLAQREAEPRPCAAQAEASVVTSNAVTGALMVWMLQEMVAGRVRHGVWEYDGRGRDTRVGVHSARPACDCHCAPE
jgi:molybdopterin/thiamine biosynthesis adenylyltransferase